MRAFKRGEKSKLSDLTPSQQVTVSVSFDGPDTYDVSLFGVDASGKLTDDRYFIFFNQLTSPEGAIHASGLTGGGAATFQIDLARLPGTLQRLVFTAAIDGNGTMANLRSGSLTLAAGGSTVASVALSGSDFSAEKALMIAELYVKDVWRFASVGQGFNGGLSALLAHFGGQELGAAAAPPAAPTPAPAPAPAPPPAPKVNLGKVTLDKRGDQRTVSLAKGQGDEPIHVNLNWHQGTQKRGFFSNSSAPDLDLGCMWELRNGDKGVIQPLGNMFGAKAKPPFIYLDKDDRSGASNDGENLYIMRPSEIRRVMVFALIYEGASDFTSVGGRLWLRDSSGAETEIYLNNPDANRTFCAVALIEQKAGGIVITKEERYFRAHDEADRHYKFGFRWSAGRK